MLLKVLIVLLPTLIAAQREPTCVFGREEYLPCAKNCNQTCGIDNEAACFSIFCAPGCYCKAGFRRDPTKGDNCVPELECPLVCTGQNEVYNPCGTNCTSQICGVDENPCSQACIRGCFCKPGFRRNPALNNVCVPENECPRSCRGANEIFKQCGTHCNQTCGPFELTCPEQCHPGCFCKEGFRRDNVTKVCIPWEHCIEKACLNTNEFFTTCANRCDDHCQKPAECKECDHGCFCRNGYKRNSKGVCVPPQECGCDANEEYKQDDRCCESCDSAVCKPKYEQGCFCKSGYKRELRTGRCVPEGYCSKVYGGSILVPSYFNHYRFY